MITCTPGKEQMVQVIFVHAHALSTVLAYHDLVPLTLSVRLPVAGLVLTRPRSRATVSGNNLVYRV
jgi:hypothetical protein